MDSLHVYAVCKNEIDFLPFFFHYYSNFAEKIVIYDNLSSDGSREFIKAQPKGVLHDFDTNGFLRDDIHFLIKNSVWKESVGVAEWVIVCDLDEILYHRDLPAYLKHCKKNKITVPETVGFNMFSEKYPEKGILITEQVKYGAFSKNFSKKLLFDPNAILEINFSQGGHSVAPEGEVNYGTYEGLKVLHYKYLGDQDKLQARWDTVGREISAINIAKKWGIKRTSSKEFAVRYSYVKRKAELVVHNYSAFSLMPLINYLRRDRKPYI